MTQDGGTLGPSIWAVSDGRAGNAAQVRAIASALSETSRWLRIAHIKGEGHRSDPLHLHPKAPLRWLPPSRAFKPLLALPKEEREQVAAAPYPTVWVGAGSRTAPYSAAVRELSQGQTLTVHVLDPRTDTTDFDVLVTPRHDLSEGLNVVQTMGSPAYFSADDVEAAGLAFADLADERGRSAIVVLGGNSRTHTFDKAAIKRLDVQLRAVVASGWRLRITCSRRTPVPARAHFRAMADEVGARFWEGASDGANPYLAWLLFSDAAIVTEDSTNMLSDAAYFGLPVHMARLTGRSEKFDRLHESLISKGIARWLHGGLETWTYKPLREADKVADRIVEELLKRFPQPDMGSQSGTVAPDWL